MLVKDKNKILTSHFRAIIDTWIIWISIFCSNWIFFAHIWVITEAACRKGIY